MSIKDLIKNRNEGKFFFFYHICIFIFLVSNSLSVFSHPVLFDFLWHFLVSYLTFATFPGFSRNYWRQRSRWPSRFSGMLLFSFCSSFIWKTETIRDKAARQEVCLRWTYPLKQIAWEKAASLVANLFCFKVGFVQSWQTQLS